MSLYLAIDAGGTKTECLLADDSHVLARAATGTVKLMRVAEEEATRRLRAMLDEVAAAAGVSLKGVTRSCFGLAGISNPAVRAWAHRIVPAMVSGEFVLCGDEEIALDAAFAGGPGILVIAGTGSNVIGRAANGERFTAGGWGPVLGDEGSGYWIGLEAIRAALRAHDRGAFDGHSSRLLREIGAHWKLDSLDELVALGNHRANSERAAPDFAALAPVVARCAEPVGDEPGDALAASVLERAGDELAGQVALVFQKMTGHISNDEGIGVAFTGSVLTHIARVRTTMVASLAVSVPAARVRDVPVDSLEGALWRARRA